MIVTLTPNPSLDRTLQLDRLVRGGVHRALGGRIDPGGKGVNVSRALSAHGITTTAVLPLGGPDGARLAELLDGLGVIVSAVPVAGSVRSNITVAEPDGTTTKLNEPGPTLTEAECSALVDAVVALAGPGTWVVGSGSLPGGLPDSFYADLLVPLHAAGAQVAIDSSGEATALHGEARIAAPVSTVGAGDALLAGYLSQAAAGASARDCLTAALAWGAAATSLPGSRMPAPDDVAAIAVTLHDHVDEGRHLEGDPA
jgi:fructose-1-phosphate kinase PfkB-like protein